MPDPFPHHSEIFTSNGTALGYDPVAYFKEGKSVKGSNDFSYSWNNVIWNFSSHENLEAFKEHPEKFAPQFGGYCAYGMSQKLKGPPDPDAGTILNGKLYLCHSKDVQQLWETDREKFIRMANENWLELKDEE